MKIFTEKVANSINELLLNKKENLGSVSGNLSIKANSELASIEVNGTQTEEIHIEYFSSEALTDEEIKHAVTVNLDIEKNILQIEEDGSSDKLQLIKITIPVNCSTEIQSEMGSIYLSNLKGNQKYDSELGSVKIKAIEGNIEGNSENGKISIVNSTGVQKITSENGKISLKHNKGDFEIRTENGMIKMQKCVSANSKIFTENGRCKVLGSTFEQLVCQTENGSVYFEIIDDKGDFTLKSENGKITAIVPKNDNINYQISTENGTVKIGIGGEYESEKNESGKVIKMKKGSGELKLDVSTENGSIVVIDDPESKIFKTFNHSANWTDNFAKNFNIPNFDFDFDDLKGKIKESINVFKTEGKKEAKREIKKVILEMNELKDSLMKENKDKISGKNSEKLNKQFETVIDKLQKNLFKFDNKELKKEVNEQSKMKILQMLEDKKITVEEAEKLLKGLGS